MKDLVIVGHGGLAREVTFLVEEINRHAPQWNLLGFISSNRESIGRSCGDYSVRGDDDWLAGCLQPVAAALAIGNPRFLPVLHQRFRGNERIVFPNLVHPGVTGDWGRITMGEGNLVLNAAAFTTGITLGSFNVFNPGCTVSHDCTLGSYNFIGPGAHIAGEVTLGNRILAGVGAQVLPRTQVCDDVRIGAGAVVTEPITAPGTYIGVPARRLPDAAPAA